MEIQPRYCLNKKRQRVLSGIILISENTEESELIDGIFGSKVIDSDGLIGIGKVEARLSDGYGEHYLYIPKKKLV